MHRVSVSIFSSIWSVISMYRVIFSFFFLNFVGMFPLCVLFVSYLTYFYPLFLEAFCKLPPCNSYSVCCNTKHEWKLTAVGKINFSKTIKNAFHLWCINSIHSPCCLTPGHVQRLGPSLTCTQSSSQVEGRNDQLPKGRTVTSVSGGQEDLISCPVSAA